MKTLIVSLASHWSIASDQQGNTLGFLAPESLTIQGR